jgi:GNAT superfamily N-acetyltransferase
MERDSGRQGKILSFKNWGNSLDELHTRLRDGAPIVIRQLVAADVALYPDFLKGVTPGDLRFRFFGSTQHVSDKLIDELVHYDPANAMAFIALDDRCQKMLGVVRLHNDSSGEGAEFAILVRSGLKSHGIGWILMKHMIEYANSMGIQTVHGIVLKENLCMLTMCSDLGFQIADDPDDFEIKVVTLNGKPWQTNPN